MTFTNYPNGIINKMLANRRKFVRVVKFLLAVVTVFCFSWIASVSEWHTAVRWTSRGSEQELGFTTMRTIVAYSEGKQAEMDRPMPVTCTRLPVFPKLLSFNRRWSPNTTLDDWQHVGGASVSLYAAYYDDRLPQRYVRILAMFTGREFSSERTLFCQTRSTDPNNDYVEVVAAKPVEIWYHMWDNTRSEVFTPLLLSCPLTESLYGPSVVSVVTQPCDDPTNGFHLKTPRNLTGKRMFTICVKDMKFDKDISESLKEWIETNRILGVDMIDMYVDEITKETENVLLHYQIAGYVRLFHVPIKHKSSRSLWQRRRDHILTYNDCLYRNLKQSEFIVPLDVDEIILPKIVNTWPELLTRLKSSGWNSSQHASILAQNVFFFDFMQDLNLYKKVIEPESLKYKMYIKRDNVRIKKTDNLEIGDVVLMDDANIYNKVIDVNLNRNIDKIMYDMYKSRCGREMVVPKLARHIISSAMISPVRDYSKSWMSTQKVLTAFNHYPLSSLGKTSFLIWSAPLQEVQLNHYKESCNTTVFRDCAAYGRRARIDTAALRLRRNLTRALAHSVCTPINYI